MHTHTSHTDFSTDLSWDGQSLTLWQQWRREGVGRGGLEGSEDSQSVVWKYSTCAHIYTLCEFTQQQLTVLLNYTQQIWDTYLSIPHLLHTHKQEYFWGKVG